MSLYGAFSCSDGSWKSPGVAQNLSLLAPRLAPRDLADFANVRASENSIDCAQDGDGRLRDRSRWQSCVNWPEDPLCERGSCRRPIWLTVASTGVPCTSAMTRITVVTEWIDRQLSTASR